MKQIEGGVCAAKGFQAAGVYCGIRKNKSKKDLALIVSQVKAACACVYTQNLVQGAPIAVTKANVKDGYASAIICNSGNANTCNANGVEIATQMCDLLGAALKIPASDVVVASTGVIGKTLDIEPIASGIAPLVAALGDDSNAAAEAIMTTDLKKKEIAFEFTLDGKACHIGGICKGSGMIQPNMATMLGFVTTDAAISPAMLQQALSAVRNDYSLARLYAMGVDAWALANHFTQMRQVPGFELNGNTGDLTATQDCVINRKLSWLKYQQGQIVPAS